MGLYRRDSLQLERGCHPDYPIQGPLHAGYHAGVRNPGDITAGRRAMNELDRIGMFLMDLPVYLANGGWSLPTGGRKFSRTGRAVCDPAAPPDANPAASRFRPPRNDRSQNNGINQPTAAHAQAHDSNRVYSLADRPMGYGRPVPWFGAACGLEACWLSWRCLLNGSTCFVCQSRDRYLALAVMAVAFI